MPWTAIGESAMGTSHRRNNTPCQDAFRYRTTDSGLLLVVADGAGSAAHADWGATAVCDAIVGHFNNSNLDKSLTREEVVEVITAARQILFDEAEIRGTTAREFACTLLLAAISPSGTSFAQIGDGAIVVGHDGQFRSVFWPEAGEYANTTDFLTDTNFLDRMQFAEYTDPIDQIAVFSDGLQRLALDYQARAPFTKFFEPLFRWLKSSENAEDLLMPLREFLDSDDVNCRTDDDKTLVFAVRR